MGRRSELLEASAALKAAGSVVVVGAGAVGVELAAEVAGAFKGKKVVLITSQSKCVVPDAVHYTLS